MSKYDSIRVVEDSKIIKFAFKSQWKRLGIYFVLLYGWLFYLGYISQILAMKWDTWGTTDDYDKFYSVYRMLIHGNFSMAFVSMWYESPLLFTLAVTFLLIWLLLIVEKADRLQQRNNLISFLSVFFLVLSIYQLIELLLK